MCDCGCDCDFLICDFTFLFIRCISEKKCDNKPSTNAIFVIRCLVGLLFDAIEYGILTATADNIKYDRFKDIFIVYGVFVAIILFTFLCTDKEVYIFIAALFFKCISLSVAFSIFTTTSHFEWETIETSFTTIGSVGDFFTALLIFVSFADICLSIGALILKFGFICLLSALSGEKEWSKAFCDLMCKSEGEVGVGN